MLLPLLKHKENYRGGIALGSFLNLPNIFERMTCWHRGGFTPYLIKRERISAETGLWASFVIFADQSNDVGNCKCVSKSTDNDSQNKSRSNKVGFCSEKYIREELKATAVAFQCWKRSKRCCPFLRHLLCLQLQRSAAPALSCPWGSWWAPLFKLVRRVFESILLFSIDGNKHFPPCKGEYENSLCSF